MNLNPVEKRLVPGLVSVTFRSLSPEAVAAVAVEAGLLCIEWGGDVHVPHGNVSTAAKVRDLCAQKGLSISTYASYYRAGVCEAASNPTIQHVLETALAVAAPSVRVWAGDRGSAATDADQYQRIVLDLRSICDVAGVHGLSIGIEYHERTFTDTPHSAMRLARDVGAANLYCNWQPRVGVSVEENLADIEILRPCLGDVHVYHLAPDRSRRLLREGHAAWQEYLAAILQADQRSRHVSLEFVKDDDPQQLLADARTLLGMIHALT